MGEQQPPQCTAELARSEEERGEVPDGDEEDGLSGVGTLDEIIGMGALKAYEKQRQQDREILYELALEWCGPAAIQNVRIGRRS